MTLNVTYTQWHMQTLTSFQHCGLYPFVPQTNRLSWNFSMTVMTFSQGPCRHRGCHIIKSSHRTDSIFHSNLLSSQIIILQLLTSWHCWCPGVFRVNFCRGHQMVDKLTEFSLEDGFKWDILNSPYQLPTNKECCSAQTPGVFGYCLMHEIAAW